MVGGRVKGVAWILNRPKYPSAPTTNNRWLTENVDGASYRTGLAGKSYVKRTILAVDYIAEDGEIKVLISAGSSEGGFLQNGFSLYLLANAGKIALNTSDRGSNLDLPVIGSLVYCDSSSLDHAATEAVYPPRWRMLANALVVLSSTAEDGEIESPRLFCRTSAESFWGAS
uniref:Uncharacterized protein n=1 Tax=Timema douglasi TaxID=61478 RepID=A0A7R8VMG7_TIMDO|nr:unnamed protein product [Timema douglasi]